MPLQDQRKSEHRLIIDFNSASVQIAKRRTCSLPEEIMFTILLFLPAQTIYKETRCVCWAWYNIIHSPFFSKAHLMNSTTGLLIGGAFDSENVHYVEIRNGKLEVDVLKLRFSCDILAACRGLVVVIAQPWTTSYVFYIMNPVTGEVLSLPCLPVDYSTCEFALGYAASSDVYKLVVPYDWGRSHAIFTAGVDVAWRYHHIPSHVSRSHFFEKAFSIASYIYWTRPHAHGDCILQFDVEAETLQKIPLPLSCCGEEDLCFFEMGGCLSMLHYEDTLIWDIWLLTEPNNGIGGWTNLLKIDLQGKIETLERICSVPLLGNGLLRPEGWLKSKDELLLVLYVWAKTCVLLNVKTGELAELTPVRSYLEGLRVMSFFFPHVNNLVSIK